MFGYIVLALLFLWGVLMIVKPDFLWSIEHSGAMDREQPTDRYIKNMRIGGIVCIVITVFLVVFYFL